MTGPAASPELRAWVERWGVLFEASRMPPAAGRIWGWLLLAPGGASSKELCDALAITKGAVSTSVRLLEGAGLVERVRRPGSRAYRYRLRDDALEALMDGKLEAIRAWRSLSEEGVELAREAGADASALRRLADFYAFMGDRQRELIEEWRARREGGEP